MDAIKKKLRSVALLALVSVTVTGLPIAPPQTHYSQQPVQTEHQFHAPQEHRQRNQDDRFEHSSMNLDDICAHHSHDSRHLELCHPKLGPRNYPRPYQPDPHMSNNAFPKQAPQIRIRRGPEQQGNSFPKERYFINRDQDVAQEQRIPINRNHAGTRGPTGRHSMNRAPFESIPLSIPPQDLNQPPCSGPGCPPYQNAQQRSPQHIHAPIIVDPPTISTNPHYPWQQSHGPAQNPEPPRPSQNPHMPNDSSSIKPNHNDDIRKLMAPRGNPTNPKASYASKQLQDSKPCSLSSSSGKSCRILIIYDFSDADVTYETRLETFE